MAALNKIFQLQIVQCDDGRFVSLGLSHKGRKGCTAQKSNTNYVVAVLSQTLKGCFRFNITSNNTAVCPDLHYVSSNGCCVLFSTKCHSVSHHCEIYLHHENQLRTKTTQTDKSNRHDEISETHQPVPFTDCKETEIKAFLADAKHFIDNCTQQNEIQCTFGCSKCFPIHKFCVYELNKKGRLMHCPSGAHLKNCNEMECSNMLKCFKSYCVPYR